MESKVLEISYIRDCGRYDFRYFEDKYLENEKRINQGRYPSSALSRYVQEIVNFGAYSLCNLLEWHEEGVPYLKVKNLHESGINWSNVLYISKDVHLQLPKSKVYSGDVLYSMAGTIGLSVVAPENLGECNSNQAIAKIRVKPEKLNPYYLSVFLNSKLGKYQSERIANGQTVFNINMGEISSIKIPIPPIHIQNKIAEFMHNIYFLQNQKQLESQQITENIIKHNFQVLEIPNLMIQDTKRFIVDSSKLDRLDVRYFSPMYTTIEHTIQSGRYKIQSLKNICTKISNGLTPSKSNYTEDGHVVIKAGSLSKNWFVNWNKVSFTSKSFFEKSSKAHVENDDLLILSASPQLNYIGRSFSLVKNIPNYYYNKCLAVGELIILRPNQKIILPEYLLTCFIMKPIQELVNRMSRGQTAHLYAEDLKHLHVPVPPLEVQKLIVDEFNKKQNEAYQLKKEAEKIVVDAKKRVERMILGEEDVT